MTPLLLGLLLLATTPQEPPAATALDAARAGAWELALRRFEEALQDPEVAPGPVHYAMGNCCWRLGRLAEASLHYRRAQRHLGRDPEVVANLRLVEAELGLSPPEAPGMLRSFMAFLAAAPEGVILSLSILLQLLGWGGLSFLRGRGRRLAAASVLLAGLGLGVWLLAQRPELAAREAVVLEREAPLRAEPHARSTPRVRLRAGEVVTVSAASDRWVLVRRNGEAGWMRRDLLGIVD